MLYSANMFKIYDTWYNKQWYTVLYGTLYHITREGLVPVKEVREEHIELSNHNKET